MSLSKSEIRQIAQKAVTIFESAGLTCCLFGGAACELNGCSRTPNDVDLIVMTSSYTTETLKNTLVAGGGGDFYTRPSKMIGATYRLLFCRIPTSSLFAHKSCKVDILIPGIMNLPMLPTSSFVRIDNLPVLPFSALLLMKVQGWSDHRKSERSDYRLKQHQDAKDVNELLAIGKERGERLTPETLPSDFWLAGMKLIVEYVNVKGGRMSWEELGLQFS
ncbi:hypothetical protein EIP91_001809 [Steccherinum ochraceum]|uniref:Uncharacterized protein n=1 Tax=Steccherinum ochraceum TaxID=92696 RepID=A0A4R0S0Z0_9APHY|nr:hypothetical protein EIP91_001809 [Steccherinum ochraceum]